MPHNKVVSDYIRYLDDGRRTLKALNGYTTLDSGIILQWGHVPANTQPIFPISFPTACLQVIVQLDWRQDLVFGGWDVFAQDITKNGFTRPDIYAGCRYIAIGY